MMPGNWGMRFSDLFMVLGIAARSEMQTKGVDRMTAIHSAGAHLKGFLSARGRNADAEHPFCDYVAGRRGGKLSTQHMVRGHYKMQRHGEGGAQRKWIHVEPYWRGDENAPIAVRSHVLGVES